jgi:hypothetical protein
MKSCGGTPLSRWGKPAEPVTGKIDPSVGMKTPPKIQVDALPQAVRSDVQTIGSIGKRLHGADRRIEAHVGVQFIPQAVNDLLIAADDRVDIAVSIDVHEHIFEEFEPIRQMRRRRHVAMAHDADIPARPLV